MWRIFDFRFSHYPSERATWVLGAAIYLNFFAHHWLSDVRLPLFAAMGLLFRRTRVLAVMGIIWAIAWLCLGGAGLRPGTVAAALLVCGCAAIFALGSYAEVKRHLLALTWGAEDLPAAIGATAAREADGRYTAPIETVRSLALFGAHAAGVPAIETVYPAFRDLDGLAAYAARGRRDGFSGMMAIHLAQVAVINAGFSPSEAEIAHARAIVDAFAANPGAGALKLDGKMIDKPHLNQALKLLALAEQG